MQLIERSTSDFTSAEYPGMLVVAALTMRNVWNGRSSYALLNEALRGCLMPALSTRTLLRNTLVAAQQTSSFLSSQPRSHPNESRAFHAAFVCADGMPCLSLCLQSAIDLGLHTTAAIERPKITQSKLAQPSSAGCACDGGTAGACAKARTPSFVSGR